MTGPLPGTTADELTPAPPAELADVVADAVTGCSVVAGLVGSTLATFLPGRRVAGVRIDEESVTVAVVLRLDDRPLAELAEVVRTCVAEVAGERRVDVMVEDVVKDPGDEAGQAPDPYP